MPNGRDRPLNVAALRRAFHFAEIRVPHPRNACSTSPKYAPGVGHADTPASVAERETGILENELVVADIGALAAAVGFRDSSLLVSTPFFRYELPTGELGAFAGGAGFSEYWGRFSSHLMVHHCILLHTGAAGPTTARPGDAALLAGIGIVGPSNGRGLQPAGQSGHAVVSVENRGNAVWLHAEGRGWTRLGGHLSAVNDGTREIVDHDWLRVGLARDVEPGDRTAVNVELPAIDRPGSYEVEFDVVLEGVTWFAERGSPTTSLPLTVE